MTLKNEDMITGSVQTVAGEIPQVATRLRKKDIIGTIKVRWGINRNNYKVDPGLYAVGNADKNSDVFVSANYKLSFDHLRKNLDGLNAWILVLDTRGVNVWCAAGKGTFGTQELVDRIRASRLDQVVDHRKVIVPQLGAVGVSAHRVKALTSSGPEIIPGNSPALGATPVFPVGGLKPNQGFRVIFGPVRASDIKPFIANGYRSTPEMRKIHFRFTDRIRLVPTDILYHKYKLLAAIVLLFLLSSFGARGFDLGQGIEKGIFAAVLLLIAYLTGIVLTPALLPYLPGRMFALKGLLCGLAVMGLVYVFVGSSLQSLAVVSWFLLMPAITSFMAMNFTGSSTYTSLSGVKKEMKIFVPVQIALAVAGLIVFIVNLWV